MTDEEFAEKLDRYLTVRAAQQKPKRGRKKKVFVETVEPDYDSMDLATLGDHVSDSMGDCTELAINEFMDMARSHRKGNTLKAVGHGAKGVVGTGLVVYGVVELLRVALGSD